MSRQLLLRRFRIITGLVLMFYLSGHFLNHAFGLVSLSLANTVGDTVSQFWQFPPISLILYGSLLGHFLITLFQFFAKRTIRLPFRDWVQLILGLSIPILMLGHIMGTRYASQVYGISPSYDYILLASFVWSPMNGIMNALGLVAAWVHGCIGVHMWLRGKRLYSGLLQMYALILATLLPLLALGGYLSAGREVVSLSSDGDWLGQFYKQLSLRDESIFPSLIADTNRVWYAILYFLAALLVARLLRDIIAYRRNRAITINYLDGPTIHQPKNQTLLEMSKNGGVPHANVCGGRGRCSTCRVKILDSSQDLSDISPEEQKVLDRIGAPDNVRLACQLVPESDMDIMLLLPAETTQSAALRQEPWSTGQERVVAILFADLRDFTSTSESKLPFDVVYLINQFSRAMGMCVESHHGRIDKFLGDGLMAIFGIESSPADAAKDALSAAYEMGIRLSELNKKLEGSLDSPLRMGVGVHIGPVVIGSMGYGASRGLTAIGDTVNTASRLESETKNHNCLVCVSAEIADLANIDLPSSCRKQVKIRGKSQELDIYAVDELNVSSLASGSNVG